MFRTIVGYGRQVGEPSKVNSCFSTLREKKRYLQRFPAACASFNALFNRPAFDELYPTYEQHLTLLNSLLNTNHEKVVSIWFGVATNCSWDADAVGLLQKQLATYGATETPLFAKELARKDSRIRLSIIKFIADVENHAVYSEYQAIERKLKQLGFASLRRDFLAAKRKRIQEKDHAF